MTDAPIRTALVSVSDRTGLVPFVRTLASRGVRIVSTGGTAATLRDAGIPVTPIDELTGFPEIMDGRVKTLHPKVHGGLLARRDLPLHLAQMAANAISPIDLVCVNLYPFEQTVARPGCSREDAIEHIDIGGPSMLRSAAKNHQFVTVVTAPSQYDRVLADLSTNNGATSLALRMDLARDAFATTARYDSAIASYLAASPDTTFPHLLNLSFARADELRYGENPHQPAALYRRLGSRAGHGSVVAAEQLHGKELSYNNLNDAHAAFSLVQSLNALDPAQCGAAIVKHTNPCGAAIAPALRSAVDLALAGDPLAAYGGILAVNRHFDADAADRLRAKDLFLEVIVAPSFAADALDILRARWTNVRLLATGPADQPESATDLSRLDFRALGDGLLVQQRDAALSAPGALALRAGPEPGTDTRRAAVFLEAVVRFLFSNAVVIGGIVPGGNGPQGIRVFGAGAGQMDRVASCRLAIEKAGPLCKGAICVSDAFFPFSDGPELLIKAGVSTIVHPGGSKRDQDTFDLCAAAGVACLTSGLRHFRH